jgi:hypothetical protein
LRVPHPNKRYIFHAALATVAGIQLVFLDVADTLVSGKVHNLTTGDATYLTGVGTAGQRPKIMTNADGIARNLAMPLDLNMVFMVMDIWGSLRIKEKGFTL